MAVPSDMLLTVNGAIVRLLGTVPGFVPEAERVRLAFADFHPTTLALGVPPEDLEALAALAAETGNLVELTELDEAQVRFHDLLERFGPVAVPSPDLATAYAAATTAVIPIHALDLDDLAHSHAYTSRMKVRHLVRSANRRKKALATDFSHVSDAHSLAIAWDEALLVKPLRALDAQREVHMASELRKLATPGGRILAVIPVTRLAGVQAALGRLD